MAKKSGSSDGSDKAAKFVKLANHRVNRLIKLLRQLRPLGNKKVYDYSDIQAAKIVETLDAEVDKVRDAFAGAVIQEEGFTV